MPTSRRAVPIIIYEANSMSRPPRCILLEQEIQSRIRPKEIEMSRWNASFDDELVAYFLAP